MPDASASIRGLPIGAFVLIFDRSGTLVPPLGPVLGPPLSLKLSLGGDSTHVGTILL